MKYNLRFKLDVKKNVYISKKVVTSAEPYYQISAIITINKKREISSGYWQSCIVWILRSPMDETRLEQIQ